MKHRSIPTSLGRLAALGLLLALPASAAFGAPEDQPPQATPPQLPQKLAPMPTTLPTISIDQVKRGQRGYGLSVFAGTEPERFDVEVVGVMRNVSPDVSYILARLEGKGLDKIGVAAGMSGSPVFLDGKLAGAVAFSWPFSQETIAGITPIESMRRLSGLGPLPATQPLPPVPLADILSRKIPVDLVERELARFQPRVAGGALPGIQWSTTGFGEQSLGMMRRALSSVTPAGEARPGDVPRDVAMGGAVAAVLVDGDFGLAAFGTVTDRYEDQVLAFGHPFLGLGPIKVPMATSEVVTIFSSQLASFKISNLGDTIGAFEQDRQAGIQGRIGSVAPMTPMVLRVTGSLGERPREYKVRIAEVPQFSASLIGSTVVAGLESASYTAGPQSLDMVARFKLARYGDLEVRQSFDGDNAGTEAAAYVLAVAGFLGQNTMEKVDLEEVEVDIRQSPLPRVATLVGAHAERTVVRPGERIGLNLDMVAYRGERFRRSMKIDLPLDLPAGRYTLLVGDGSSIDAARMSLAPAPPVTFRQAFDLLNSFHSRRDLVVLGVHGGPGLSVAGEVMPRLPGSVRSLWSAAPSGSATALRSTIAQELRETLDVPLDGMVQIDLEVRRREPVLAGETGEAGEAGDAGAAPDTEE
jgi:hypothetical protein